MTAPLSSMVGVVLTRTRENAHRVIATADALKRPVQCFTGQSSFTLILSPAPSSLDPRD